MKAFLKLKLGYGIAMSSQRIPINQCGLDIEGIR